MRHVPILLIFIIAMMGYRIWRMSNVQRGPRPLGIRLGRFQLGNSSNSQLAQLWILPALLGAGVVLLFARRPPHGQAWLWVAIAVALGAAVGWWRGGLIRLTINPRTGQIVQQASPVVYAFIIGLFALRFGLRLVLNGGMARHAATYATDGLIVFTFAMFTVQRLEMFLRARRLLSGRVV